MGLRQSVWAAIVACVVAVCACGGGSASSACSDYYDALEGYYQDCVPALAADPSNRAASVQACSDFVSQPDVGDLAGELETCTSKVKALTSCATTGFGCTLHGTLADGSPCASAAQCSGGLCSNTTSSSSSELACGTCASYVALGATCSTTLPCDPTTGACENGKCAAYGSVGDACSAQAPCGVNLACGTGGTCGAIPTNGQPCTTYCQNPYRCIGGTCGTGVAENGACTTGECAEGLSCVAQVCTKPVLASSGQPCGLVQNEIVQCAAGFTCQAQICTPAKEAGAACTVGNHECDVALLCIGGTCQKPDYSACNQ